MQHSFDVDLAKRFGVLEAILLNNLDFWIAKNKANGNNYHDGFYWTYNSARAFQELFPYVSQRQIQNALKHLREEEILQTGNFNEMAYDRTMWYAFTKKGISIMQKCQMESAKMSNANDAEGQPIPDINTDNKPNRKTDRFAPPTLEEVQAYCHERKNSVDAQRFIDYYTANGWRVGKNKMKDWKAAVRTWERNGYSSAAKSWKKTEIGANGVKLKPEEERDHTLDGIL